MFVHNMPENVQVFSWFTGVMVLKSHEISRYVVATSSCMLEPTHSGRETAVNNGSLLIKMSPGKTRAPILGFKKHTTPSQPAIELVPPMVTEKNTVFFYWFIICQRSFWALLGPK
ncbi:hypothetical protein U0070_016191, partial [Myodes glareolus]